MTDALHPIDPQNLLTESARLRGIARRLIGQCGGAEDLVQDTWVTAIEADMVGKGTWRDEAGWRAWVGAVTRNLALRRRRRESQRGYVEREAARAESVEARESIAERMELQRQLADAIQGLDEPYRDALVLRYLDGLELREVANRQGVSYANARQRVSRALSMLRDKLGVCEQENKKLWGGLGAIFGSRPDATAGAPATLEGVGAGFIGSQFIGFGGLLMGAKLWTGVVLAVVGVTIAVQFTGDDKTSAGTAPHALVMESDEEDTGELSNVSTDLGAAPTPVPRELVAQRSDAIEVPQAAAPRVVFGVVTNQRGEPLAEVDVRWTTETGEDVASGSAMVTEPDGEFRLERPKDGFIVRFQHAKYLPIWVTSEEGTNVSKTLLYDEPMTVALRARPQLAGVVTGPDGVPAEPPGEVKLYLLDPDGAEGGSVQTEIGAGGRYVFDQLSEGSVMRVQARAKGFDELEQDGAWPLVADTSTTLDLELPAGITVIGTVVDAETKQPIPYAEVWTSDFEYDAESSAPTGVADAGGRFRLEGVTPSDMEGLPEKFELVWIAGNSPDHIPTPFNPSYAREVEPGVFELELELVPSSCSVRIVVYESGREALATGVYVWTIDSQKNFKHATTNRHGEIELDALPPGEFMFAAYRQQRNQEGIFTSATLNLDLAVGAHERHEVELRGDARTGITGVAAEPDGTPVAGVEMKATYTLRFNGLMLTVDSDKTVTDELGRYEFTGLRAGRHKVSCSRPGLPVEKTLELGWGESAEVDFMVGDGMNIRGRVELGDVKHHHVDIYLYRRNADVRLAEDTPSADGTFEFTNLPPAEYDLVLVKDEERLDAVPVGSGGIEGVVLRVQ